MAVVSSSGKNSSCQAKRELPRNEQQTIKVSANSQQPHILISYVKIIEQLGVLEINVKHKSKLPAPLTWKKIID